MDEQRARIFDDLRGLIKGDLYFDPVHRAPYAHDASLYEIDPLGVVVPRSRDDLVAIVKYAHGRGLPIHARGAGTGLAGESLGPGLVVDFSRYLRRILSIGEETITVEPGVVLDTVNAQLAQRFRRLGPDPSGSATCTIGGMIAGDAAGAHSIKYGTTADCVESLEVVFANGVVSRLGVEGWPNREEEPRDFKESVTRRLAQHLDWHADLIARSAPSSPRNRAGYALGRIATPAGINLARLLVGSEGTLALITEATLRTVASPAAQAVVLLPFGGLTAAASVVTECMKHEPAACELVDWRRLMMARDADSEIKEWISGNAEAAVAVEFEGESVEEVSRSARQLGDQMFRSGRLIAAPFVSSRGVDCKRLIDLRRLITPQFLRSSGMRRPVPLIEDIAVPPEMLAEVIQLLQGILRARGVSWTFHAHAGAGQLHVRPFLDMSDPQDVALLEPLSTEVYEVVLKRGGTISGEHGCGLVRSQFIRMQYGELADVFQEVKNAFDPSNLLNPGKIVGDDAHLMTRSLRRRVGGTEAGGASQGMLPVLNQPLRWLERDRGSQIEACNGCGDCRSQDPTLRMCPTFRGLRAENASPRAKVNLLRQIAAGAIDPRHWGSEELRAHADLCVHCGLCRQECPAQIDVSSLMIEAKAGYVENHGLTPTDWFFSRADVWAGWFSRTPILANALLGSRTARRVLERLTGLSRHRVMPRARRWSFMRRAERLGLTKPHPSEPGPRVAYFVDVFANHFDQELAESVVSVLRHVGVNVYVPRGQKGCGMPALVVGDLERARELVHANLRIMAEAVRDGYTIVSADPTATLMLQQEVQKLTEDLDAELVARNTMDVCDFLLGLHKRKGLPLPSHPLHARVGYHQPCHQRALGIGLPGLELLRLIPGLEPEFIDRGCSGAAGIYGLIAKNFRTSLRAGQGLRSRLGDPDIEIGATECGTCRMQMEQGVTKRTHHPIKLLGMSYGLMPDLRQHFKDPKPRHVIS